MEYIIIENGRIKAHRCGPTLPQNAIEVKNFSGIVGENVNFYKADWTRKDDFSLMQEGLVCLPTGMKWNKDKTELIEMSDVEKVESGLATLAQNQVIENGEIRTLSDKELYQKGFITEEAYSKNVRNQRDFLLKDTDKYLLPDFPIQPEQLEIVKKYRQYLRDLPLNEAFPDVDVLEMEAWNGSF